MDKTKETKDKKTNLHAGHRSRMRTRFKKDGLNGFSDHECVEYLLYDTIKRANTNETAHKLINRFGSIKGILDAPYEELIKVDGVGEVTARYITGLNSRIAEAITDQLSQTGRFNDMNAAVLGDWIMKTPDNAGKCVVYICDKNGTIGHLAFAENFENENGNIDIRALTDRIISAGSGGYIIFLPDSTKLTEEQAAGISAYTKLFGAEIYDVYYFIGQRPVSLLKK